ncbi:2-oxo-3-deoxygalactonate kinase [Erwinia sp. E602]|uniref:2-dehydro-3-deoxygalactonokinase n=1 Tax=unclassified Erwinia TaxID=2622719 RepID=UPI0006F4D3E5|nr:MULTISPECIES: 2-dehydro-3-deoxygalactonokinase [unclassified Erwinia]KQN53450.1 2-oxo-3-deoxygalactonate kinase [Erwinia sp. Leaf53]PLV61900.1 2-oxo-3-deoxygalactonate kinase [Erwinia sp. B116]QUG75621.1 2-oxo-3-deoxygalactonate kinase [Erwinia sp. E602]
MSSYIAIDWGSTNLRAWHYQQDRCVDQRRSEAGVTRLNGRTPADVFDQVTAGWPVSEVPVVMAGMVGSNAGWLPVPYLACPLRLGEIASRLTRVENRAWIVPGLSVEQPDNLNVMRGEETQLLGAVALAAADLYVMPGTHAKWVRAEGDRVETFRTVMTGELHHLLLSQSLVGAGLPAQREDAAAFAAGLQIGSEDRSILSRLFEVRAAHVLGRRAPDTISEFLSGLLIGHEVATLADQWAVTPAQPLTLIAGSALSLRYQQALRFIDLTVNPLDGDVAFRHGIRSIAHALAN